MKRRQFLTACGAGLLGASMPAIGPLPTQGLPIAAAAAPQRKKRRLISNHDGGIMRLEPPLTADHFRASVRSYRGTPVDAICWCVGDREVYHYDTNVGEVFGRRHSSFEDEWHWRRYENTRRLIDSGRCPLATMVAVCREEGMGIFASVRMNSHYTIDPDAPNSSEFRRTRPDLLIGHPSGYTEGSKEYGIRMGLNYAKAEVRELMATTLIELFEKFDTDGVEMDFMRHPSFFKLHEAVERGYLLTDMLRRVKQKRDEVSRTTGRRIELIARVPPTLPDALRVGLDVRTWINEGLVDVVIAGGGFIPFEMPFEEFVTAARETEVQVYGGLEFLRFRSAPSSNVEIDRAIAMRFWNAGADGLQLFNYFAQPTYWKKNFLREIGNPKGLATMDKRYQIDPRRFSPPWGGHGAAFATAVPSGQLPVALEEGDATPRLRIRIADDLKTAKVSGKLAGLQLQLYFENYTSGDEIEVHLNGERLPHGRRPGYDLIAYWNQNQRKDRGRFLSGSIVYDVDTPPLRRGDNAIEIRLLKRAAPLAAPLELGLVEAAIQYRS